MTESVVEFVPDACRIDHASHAAAQIYGLTVVMQEMIERRDEPALLSMVIRIRQLTDAQMSALCDGGVGEGEVFFDVYGRKREEGES